MINSKNVFTLNMIGGRPNNEDSIAWVSKTGENIFIVCDGIGGGRSGEIALATVSRDFLKHIQEHTGVGSCNIRVSVLVDGQSKNVGSYKFRIKRVPDLFACIAMKRDGLISANEMIAAGAVVPKLENFDFECQFRIVSFDLSMNIHGDFLQYLIQGVEFPPKWPLCSNLQKRNKGLYR